MFNLTPLHKHKQTRKKDIACIDSTLFIELCQRKKVEKSIKSKQIKKVGKTKLKAKSIKRLSFKVKPKSKET